VLKAFHFCLPFFLVECFGQHARLSSQDGADIYDNNWGWSDHTTLKPFVDVDLQGNLLKFLIRPL